MLKKEALRTLFLFTVALGVCSAAPRLWAAPAMDSSCMIQSTPFYQKLLSAGVFDAANLLPQDQFKPVPLLFRMARAIRYDSDRKKHDRWQSADQTMQYFSGDCEDKAIWLYTQMRRNGYRDAYLIIGKYAPSSSKFHMWVTYVDDAGKTMLLDPTMQRRPWEADAFAEKLYRPLHILSSEDCVSL